MTRNQVVAQAARGFESHPVRHKSTVILIEFTVDFFYARKPLEIRLFGRKIRKDMV